MSFARVVAVAPGSPAAGAGLLPGDELLTVNGEELRDVIRYQVQADEPLVELEVRRGGLERLVLVEKAAGERLGLELDSAVFDRVRTCDNHCPFCFIYQLPKGMRKSLYLKDDDYRLSFLYGNFTTLTRFTEADVERVVTEGLSPLYVSIHATDPDLRARLLRNRRGATSLRWLSALLDAGIEVHGQIVVCPGVNDGPALDDTLLGILDRYPALRTVGVVPLGVSAHNHEPDMRPHTRAEADAVVDCVERWQQWYLDILGRRLVYASDEYYLSTDRSFPALDEYDGCPQHENGIGMARTFEAEVHAATAGRRVEPEGPRSGFFAWVEGAPADGYRAVRGEHASAVAFAHGLRAPGGPDASADGGFAGRDASADGGFAGRDASADGGVAGRDASADARPATGDASADARPVTIVTGAFGARVLESLLPVLRSAAGERSVELLPVGNRFFGGNIGVTGLLTGADVADALARRAARASRGAGASAGASADAPRFLLPDVVLSNGRFLDGRSVGDLPCPVEVVATNGVALVDALRAG
ncbi:MAG: DUF512 domain-containing protein [Acidimicrobiia bacterium]